MSIHAATESDSSCYTSQTAPLIDRPIQSMTSCSQSLQFQNCAKLAGFCGESPSPTDEFERRVTIFSILVHWLQFKRGERYFLAQNIIAHQR
jgi:hypothetical protein